MKQLEEQNRLATPEEQEILSRYVGWGGLPQAFDEQNSQWAKEYAELKELLDDEEYDLRPCLHPERPLHFPAVIKAIYACLENMGFKTGNILEPACGIGNFFGLVPESMKDSKLYGMELDSITGRIAKQLYQQANIAVQGFEETNLPDSFFDLAIGNVPFGSYGVADKKYDKYNFHIHDYFFAKTLDKVRPGGIVAFITSKGTMDKQNPEVRKYIAQRAELSGRCPASEQCVLCQRRHRGHRRHPVPAKARPCDRYRSRTGCISARPRTACPSTAILPTTRTWCWARWLTTTGCTATRARPPACHTRTPTLPNSFREALENIHAEITEYELDDVTEDIGRLHPGRSRMSAISATPLWMAGSITVKTAG